MYVHIWVDRDGRCQYRESIFFIGLVATTNKYAQIFLRKFFMCIGGKMLEIRGIKKKYIRYIKDSRRIYFLKYVELTYGYKNTLK